LPPRGVTCPVCRKGWSIKNCHDTVVTHSHEVFPLADFVGMTLGDMKASYSMKTDADYRMQSDILIRNDRFIDLSPKYPEPKHDWEQGVVKNERGWVSAKEGIDDNYVIHSGDEGFFNVWIYQHSACHRVSRAFTEEAFFRDVFTQAGFALYVLHHLPNGYSSESARPWFRVETEIGVFTLGWRKRVISINWAEVPHGDKNIMALFETEDVTKDPVSIHAWSKEKAVEYLSKIREALSV